ncbi:TNFAIP3-interacting protein 1-like [Cheilinus undulatus]|uniref:TNFAIP3-interacting protein 1-like n=1 Tax=Cheilinus undulatus TaxID=241271 RepID=UPI001BD2116D|nr:TNFAIP3-interacting protein 1-like [Cheilinus undulatus]
MSLHENASVKPPVERSAAENKQTDRLYPSLPSVNRYDAFMADRSVEEKLNPAAVFHSGSLPGNTQFDASVGSSEAGWKAKILILEEQKQELLSINEKWAKEYRTMRQYYKEKVQDLKALLQHDYSQFEEELCERGDRNTKLKFKTLETNKSTLTGDADISSELLRAEKEAKELREQNNTLTRRGQHQNEEIKRLHKALEEALQKTQPLEMSPETLHEVWKHQAEVYKEDFLKERKDREKLKEKYWDLEKKYRKVYRELHVFKSQATQTPQQEPECHCTTPPKCPNWEVQHINKHHMVLQRR